MGLKKILFLFLNFTFLISFNFFCFSDPINQINSSNQIPYFKPAGFSLSAPFPSSTIMAMQCASCSSTVIKTFSITLAISQNSNCTSAQTLTFSNTNFNSSSVFYMDGSGLAAYASTLSLPISSGIQCARLSSIGALTMTARVTGTSPNYTRTFPTNPPILALS